MKSGTNMHYSILKKTAASKRRQYYDYGSVATGGKV